GALYIRSSPEGCEVMGMKLLDRVLKARESEITRVVVGETHCADTQGLEVCEPFRINREGVLSRFRWSHGSNDGLQVRDDKVSLSQFPLEGARWGTEIPRHDVAAHSDPGQSVA